MLEVTVGIERTIHQFAIGREFQMRPVSESQEISLVEDVEKSQELEIQMNSGSHLYLPLGPAWPWYRVPLRTSPALAELCNLRSWMDIYPFEFLII